MVVSITYSRRMGQRQSPAKGNPPNDWKIVVGWAGAIQLAIVLIGCPLYRKAKHERSGARAEKTFGHLPALQKAAGEVEAECRRADSGSTVDVGVSARVGGDDRSEGTRIGGSLRTDRQECLQGELSLG